MANSKSENNELYLANDLLFQYSLLQLVRREFSRQLPRLQCWVEHGFAVVLLDNRGSINRGLQFEAHIKVASSSLAHHYSLSCCVLALPGSHGQGGGAGPGGRPAACCR